TSRNVLMSVRYPYFGADREMDGASALPLAQRKTQNKRPLSRSEWGPSRREGLSDGRGLVRHEQPGDEVDQDLRAGEEEAGHEGDSDDGGIDVEVAGGFPRPPTGEPGAP